MSDEKNHSGRQDKIRNAAQRAVDATLNFGITVVRSDLKKRLHRTPTDEKVFNSFQDWVTHGDFAEYSSTLTSDRMRRTESQFGKPSKEWSYDELLQAYEDVEWYFLKLSELYERPKGHPPKIKIQGIVSKVQRDGAIKRRKSRSEKLRSLENPFIRSEEFSKLGIFAKKERDMLVRGGESKVNADKRVGSLGAIFQYMIDADMEISQEEFDAGIFPDEVRTLRLSRGTFQSLLKKYGIDPKDRAAFKMRISRARRRSS